MASPRSKTMASTSSIETSPILPRARAGQDRLRRCERRVSSIVSLSCSPPLNLAPPSTVVKDTMVLDKPSTSNSSPHSITFGVNSSTVRRDGTISCEDGHRSCSSPKGAKDGDDDGRGHHGNCDDTDSARTEKDMVVTVESNVVSLNGGADFDVRSTGAFVRWTRKKKDRPQQLEDGGSWRQGGHAEADGSHESRKSCSISPTITFLSDDTDDLPVTRQISCHGESFRRPGRYTYILSSGPLTVGRVLVSEAPNEGGAGKGCNGRQPAVDKDSGCEHAAAVSSLTPTPEAKTGETFEADPDSVAPRASQASAPPENEKKTTGNNGGHTASDSQTGGSYNGTSGNVAGSGKLDEDRQDQAKAMIADQLTSVPACKFAHTLDGLCESSAFASRLVKEPPTEVARHSNETPLREDSTGLPEPFSRVLVPPFEMRFEQSTFGGNGNDGGSDAEKGSERSPKQSGSPAALPLLAPPPSLDAVDCGQSPRRGIPERATANHMNAGLGGGYGGMESPREGVVLGGGQRSVISSTTKERAEECDSRGEMEEVELREITVGRVKVEDCGKPKYEGGGRGSRVGSDHATEGDNGDGENKGYLALYISSSCSETGESSTQRRTFLATPASLGLCKEKNIASVASFRPVGEDVESDPPLQVGDELTVETKEASPETTADKVPYEGTAEKSKSLSLSLKPSSPSTEPLEWVKTTVPVHATGGGSGFTGGVGKVEFGDDPNGILNDDSVIDSDDGTAASSQSVKGETCEDKRWSTPLPPSQPICSLLATQGFRASGSYAPDVPGTILESRVPRDFPTFQIEVVRREDKSHDSQKDGGVTRQEWHDGMSPLTSPMVGERLGDTDDGGGFRTSEYTVLPSHDLASERKSEDGRQPCSSKVDEGINENEDMKRPVYPTLERARVVASVLGAAPLDTTGDCIKGDLESAVVKVIRGHSSRTSFFPEKVKIAVGATIVWELQDDAVQNDDRDVDGGEPVEESFHVRGDIPMYDNGFVTECAFELEGSNPSFAHKFREEGLFIMCTKSSLADDGKKRGEIFVCRTTRVPPSTSKEKDRCDVVIATSESPVESHRDSASLEPESVSADLGGSSPEFKKDSYDSPEHEEKKSAASLSDVSRSNSSVGSICPTGDEHTRMGDAQDRIVTPLDRDEALCEYSEMDVHANQSLGNATRPVDMGEVALAAAAAATVGQAKSIAESFRISSVGRNRELPILEGVCSTGGGDRKYISDGPGVVQGGECATNQKPSGGVRIFTESLSTTTAASPKRSSHALDALSATGTREEEDGHHDGIGGQGVGRVDVRNDNSRSLDDTNSNCNETTHVEAPLLVTRAPRGDAAVRGQEGVSMPNNSITLNMPAAGNNRSLTASAKPLTGTEEKAALVVVSGSQERESVGRDTENASPKNKKKKSKKKKKKSRGVCRDGCHGDGGSGGGIGRESCQGDRGGTASDMHRGTGFDAANAGTGSQNDSALLMDEQSFLYLAADRAMGVTESGGGKPIAKTLIVADQGFKPSKPLVVLAGAAVSIKVASIRRNRGYGQDRALSISLEVPVVHTLERFVEGLPRQTVLKKTNAFGEPLVAVFRRSGEYWLVDHLSGKRLKVTVNEGPKDLLRADAANLYKSLTSGKGHVGRASASGSLYRKAGGHSNEGCKTSRSERVGASSRSKKKNKDKDKLAAATATTAAAADVLAARTVATSTKEALDRTQAVKLAAVSDVDHSSKASADKIPLIPPLLPPIRVKEGGDGLSADELVDFHEAAAHSAHEGVHVVDVSHRQGFEPAVLEVSLTPGLGACIMCNLDCQQQVTREVVCKRLVCEEAGTNNNEVVQSSSSEGTAAKSPNLASTIVGDEGEDGDDPNVRTARLGPGSLRKCHFILGRSGKYKLSYRNEEDKGLTVLVRSTALSREGKGSARFDDMPRSPSLSVEDRSLKLDDVIKSPPSDEADVSGDDEHLDSAAASSSDNSEKTTSPVNFVTPSHIRSDGSSPRMVVLKQRPNVGESSVVAVAPEGEFFSLEPMMENSHEQLGFVHQRSQVKRINKRLKRNNAAAAAASGFAKESTTKQARAESGPRASMVEATGGAQAIATPLTCTDPSGSVVAHSNSALCVSGAGATSSRRGATPSAMIYPRRTAFDDDDSKAAMATPTCGMLVQVARSTLQDAEAVAEGFGAEAYVEKAAPTSGPTAVCVLGFASDARANSDKVEQHVLDHENTPPNATPVLVDSGDEDTDGTMAKECAAALPSSATAVSGETEEQQDVIVACHASCARAGVAVASEESVKRDSWGGKGGANPSYESARAAFTDVSPSRPTQPTVALTSFSQTERGRLSLLRDQSPAAVNQCRGEGDSGTPFVQGKDNQPMVDDSVGTPGVWNLRERSCEESYERGSARPGAVVGAQASMETTDLPPSAVATVETLSYLEKPSCFRRSAAEVDSPPCPPNGRSITQTFPRGVAPIEGVVLTQNDALMRPQSTSTPPEKGNYASGRNNTRAVNSLRISLKTGLVEKDRSQATKKPADSLDTISAAPMLSSSGPRATGSSTKLKKKKKKDKAAQRKAAERKTVVASVTEEPIRGPPNTPCPSTSCLPGRLHAFSEQQHPVAVSPMVEAACSTVETSVVGTGIEMSTVTTSAHPSTSLESCASLAQASTVAHPNEPASSLPESTSPYARIPLAVTARDASSYDLSKNGRNTVHAYRLPESSSGEWGSGIPPQEGLGHPSRLGLEISENKSSGLWCSTETVEKVVATMPVPATAAPAEVGAQGPHRPPPHGVDDESFSVAGAPPYGNEKPGVLPTVADKTNPADTLAPGPKISPPVIPTSGMTSSSINRRGECSRAGCSGGQRMVLSDSTRFGHCSTKVSLEERSRRNQVLRAEAAPFYPSSSSQGGRRAYRSVQAKLATFPEESLLPGGGYYVEEGPSDTLPPPSAYEVREVAYMMKVYDDMIERLRTTGMDETLPNGFTPRIYDFTDGDCC